MRNGRKYITRGGRGGGEGVCRNNLTDKKHRFFPFYCFPNYTLIRVFNTLPKGICSRATLKMFNFLSSRFSKGIKALYGALGFKGTERCGQRLWWARDWELLQSQTLEVAAGEIAHLGSCHLGKCSWEVAALKKIAFRKVPNIYFNPLHSDKWERVKYIILYSKDIFCFISFIFNVSCWYFKGILNKFCFI